MHKRWAICLLSFILVTLLAPDLLHAQWQRIESPVRDNLYDVYHRSDGTFFAVGWGSSAGAPILKSTDEGEHWSSTIPLDGSLLFCINFVDADVGYACGYDGVNSTALMLSTIDGGESWDAETFRQSFGFYVVQFTALDTGYACGYSGVIMKTENAGNNWRVLQTGTRNVFRHMEFIDGQRGWAVAGTSFNNPSQVYRTVDGGSHWALAHDFGNSFVVGGITFSSPEVGIAVGNDGRESIYRTTDGGENWVRVYRTDSNQVLQSLTFRGQLGWAIGGGGRIHTTTDGGENWELVQQVEGGPYLFGVETHDGTTLVVGETGGIYRNFAPDQVRPEQKVLPATPSLISAYPNPFNSALSLYLMMGSRSPASVELLDLTGRSVWQMGLGELSAGGHRISIEASGIPSGSYHVRFKTNQTAESLPIQLLK
jgi:photosystem II stability/assembly factor-like uncharacterized protein